MAKNGGGHVSLKTADGEMLTITPDASGKSLYVDDMKGNAAHITIADVMQSNGVIHVVNKVLMPGT